MHKGQRGTTMFKGFRAMSHLLEQLGDERFAVLIDSGNTGKVKCFCDTLVKDALPTTMTIGDRTYDILGFLRGDEKYVKGDVMVARVVEMGANLGKEDGQYLLDHQDEIPVALRGKVVFVFTDWRHPGSSEGVYYVYWDDDRWVRYWRWLARDFRGYCRVLRRKYGA